MSRLWQLLHGMLFSFRCQGTAVGQSTARRVANTIWGLFDRTSCWCQRNRCIQVSHTVLRLYLNINGAVLREARLIVRSRSRNVYLNIIHTGSTGPSVHVHKRCTLTTTVAKTEQVMTKQLFYTGTLAGQSHSTLLIWNQFCQLLLWCICTSTQEQELLKRRVTSTWSCRFKICSVEIIQTGAQILIASGAVMCLRSDAAPTSQ